MKNYTENLTFSASPEIMDRARALRVRMTPAEKLLWLNLRNRKLGGYKFRRQHPVDKFIADFYCHEKRVAIEIDGGIHLVEEQIEYDKNRTVALNNWGIEVIRFTNEEVLHSMLEVLRKIKTFCDNREF
jgi:very-short-patch-repair endonuclease